MDRNTIIAIVLSVVVIVAGMTVQTFFMDDMVIPEETVTTAETGETALNDVSPAMSGPVITAVGEEPDSSPFTVDSGAYNVTFNPRGAGITSILLADHMENGKPVELLYNEEGDADAFTMYVGGNEDRPVDEVFPYSIDEVPGIDIKRVVFTRDFTTPDGKPFTIEKSYAIPGNGEYLIQLAVKVYTPDGSPIPMNISSGMYTLSVGPQIGPEVVQKNNYDYRRIEVKYTDSAKKSAVKYKDGVYKASDDVQWISLNGKYFAFIVEPSDTAAIASVSASQENPENGIYQKNVIYMTREASAAPSVTDYYSFYAGPKVKSDLTIYNNHADNIFGISGMNMDKVVDGSWLSWLERILNWVLQLFYKIIPNYGDAIILLTILIKLLLQPLTKKGMDSTAKMSALSPKIEEIKKKFPDNPEAQNAAMAKLYKEEKINPMGSCLPMLIQFPIFIALYGLLNTNFDLRGSMFIPGWINDLSIPDTVLNLPFAIPLLGSQIHALPILYVISMIFSMKITQSGQNAGSQAGMMNFMTYGMPILFFFIMYNAPSGLLLYWSTVNLISIGQQIFVNKKKRAVYAEEIAEKDREKLAKKEAKKRNRRK